MGKLYNTALILGGIILGTAVGYIIISLIPKIPIKKPEAIEKTIGIKRKEIIGFQPYWLISKADKDYSNYLTTYTYFGLGINTDGTLVKLKTPEQEDPAWTSLKKDRFTNIKNGFSDRGLKYSLLVNPGELDAIRTMMQNPKQSADNLINDARPIMQQYGFNDLNIDIESFKTADDSDREKFTEFIKEVRNGIDQNKLGTLTIEISPTVLNKKVIIDIEKTQPYINHIVLMAYDFHYSGSYIAGPVAPINGVGINTELDVETSIQEALKLMPPEKLILGIPLYGYEWETITNQPNAAIIPGSSAAASNRRAEELISDCSQCIRGVEENSKEPYIIYPSDDGKYFRQIYYEDETSLNKKLDLTYKYDLGGVALWAIGYEGNKMLQPLAAYKSWYKWK